MHLTGYYALLFSLLVFFITAAWAVVGAWSDNEKALPVIEWGQLVGVAGVFFSSLLLLSALVARDYSFKYVFDNVDNTLPFTYTITAFWGGREGSLLFWELIIAFTGMIFVFSRGYRTLSPSTRLYFWAFFLTIQAFFLLLLTCWSNPFIELLPTPANGRGLNPLLRNPGMIFHPPLLFLGFAVYTVPAACALASGISGEAKSWVKVCRNWNILAWVFLTAGIVLGGWWSYMELGWGGYWAWDPVENASLIPWFAGTAILHTAIIEARRGALQKTNIFLMSLTFLLCIFSTYLTRSGVIDSLHTFGESGVSLPLFLSMMFGLGVTVMVVLFGERHVRRSLSDLLSRQGLLVLVAWLMLLLGAVVTLGTMWPVISKLWSAQPQGLDANFYNRVCLPFLAVVILLFSICPWLGWKEGVRHKTGLYIVLGLMVLTVAGLLVAGFREPLPVFSLAVSVGGIATALLVLGFFPAVRRMRHGWGAYGVHLGVALLALGIAASGPYKAEKEITLGQGETAELGGYQFKSLGYHEDNTAELRARATANLEVSKDGKVLGVMHPDKRIYRNFDQQQFAEVSTIPSLGNEVYATLLGFTGDDRLSFKVSINPLVNWVWIGGTIMCLFPFLLLRGLRKPGEDPRD